MRLANKQRVYFFSSVKLLTYRSFHLYLMLSKSSLKLFRSFAPTGGRRAVLMSPSVFSWLLLLAQSPAYFQDISLNVFVSSRDRLFKILYIALVLVWVFLAAGSGR